MNNDINEDINRLATTLYNHAITSIENDRKLLDASIPKIGLSEIHSQNCKLLLNRIELLKNLPVNCICAELGVDKGDFSESILSITNPYKLHLIDVWSDERYNENLYNNILIRFESELTSKKLIINRESSLTAFNNFPDNYFDWIYIDTDHSFDLPP
jgi:hypothetical protein